MGQSWPRGCERCGFTGRIQRPPEGEPPFQRIYNQSIQCPTCREKEERGVREYEEHRAAKERHGPEGVLRPNVVLE